ncbi:hypothetical protein ASPZODRAFT_61443 [Penicilliopsis zonata CBS 506.65]|uniref:HORMA domain-containing protein n=1 Tax=Penicilliopsis zonata CBS 506.65 TaxID=1073090 RepID=A0A1L9SQ03_9EURO|nr:hypothetical protein ASPZODRAFT_61443 [Penicilliopsis zonata CBS 506.65]OJJ49137.1 hypothetical protein ASPZODRAFT_61443 [Penicilliopsis zonata CBS 506.65]
MPATTERDQNGQVSEPEIRDGLQLQHQQSLEMVQIMLHVTLGTLFYLREFLPLECFDDRDLKQAHREQKFSYEDFVSSSGAPSSLSESVSEQTFGQRKRGQPLKILLRNTNPKTDMILDLLEHGIFDALKKRVLEAIQLTVVVDKEAPENVLETYTFSFKYTSQSTDPNSCLESLSLDPVGCVADMRTTQAARTGLEMIVRRLITLSAFLPILPNKRSLGIHLFYTKDCSPDYDPPGFTASKDDIIRYPLEENWRKESQSCGSMTTADHKVGLRVTSMKWTGPDLEGSDAAPAIPEDIEYHDEVVRGSDIGFPEDEELSSQAEKAKNKNEGTTQSTSIHGDMSQVAESSLESTQARQDIMGKQRLQQMIPTSSFYSGSDLVPTQPLHAKPVKDIESEKLSQITTEKFVLSAAKAAEIKAYRLLQDHNESERGMVDCQCDWDGEEPEMLECSFCRTRQHLICYGYRNKQDARLPDIHACYKCLLLPNEPRVLRSIQDLVPLRRALLVILDDGYPLKIGDLGEKIHCSGPTAKQITDELKKRGILESTPGSKARGFSRTGLPRYRIVETEEARQTMEEKILNPMAKIDDHYVHSGTHTGRKQAEKDDSSADSNDDGEDKQETPRMSLRQTRKRKQLDEKATPKSAASTRVTRSSEAAVAPATPTSAVSTRVTRSSEAAAQATLAKDSPDGDQSLRRSSRKKRKMSNYRHLIDIGASPSGDEK